MAMKLTRETYDAIAPLIAKSIPPAWLSNSNISGTGVGNKVVNGVTTDELSIVVHVARKKPLHALTAEDIVIPPEVKIPVRRSSGIICVERIRTDVVESGRFRRCAAKLDQKVRPVPGGYQISAGEHTGTLGVNAFWNGKYRLLTNNHVISMNGKFPPKVYQPAPGIFDNQIADNVGFIPVVVYDAENEIPVGEIIRNRYDLAWCDVDMNICSPVIHMIGGPAGTFRKFRPPEVGETVHWIGSQTGEIKEGIVADIHFSMSMMFSDTERAYFEEIIQIACPPNSTREGDSGAAIVTKDGSVVGLYFCRAEKGGIACACGIPPVLPPLL